MDTEEKLEYIIKINNLRGHYPNMDIRYFDVNSDINDIKIGYDIAVEEIRRNKKQWAVQEYNDNLQLLRDMIND